MNTLFRVLGSIYFLVWSVIGVVILVGMIAGFLFVKNGGPQQALGSLLPAFSGASSGSGSAGQPELTPAIKSCIVKTLGEKRANELMSGGSPTAAEIQKLTAACGSLVK